jgi:hypothetical protein
MEEEPTTEPREITLDEAVSLAIVLQNNERVADAEQLYRRVLELAPEHPHALHYSGVLAHQQGGTRRRCAGGPEPGARAGPGGLAQQPR